MGSKIREKYTRIGPSTRVKRSVAPVKILVAPTSGASPHYRTYYAGTKKHRKYSERAIEDLVNNLSIPKYEQYVNKAKDTMTNDRLRPEFTDNLGETWSKDHVEASGALYGYMNKAIGQDTSVHVIQKLRGPNKQAVRLSDGVAIESSLDIHNDDQGNTHLQYDNKFKVGSDSFNSKLKATAKNIDGKKVLTINDIQGYDKDDLGYFVANARQKFDHIQFDETSRINSPGFSYDLMQLGFLPKENESSNANFNSIKQQAIARVEASSMTPAQKRETKAGLRKESFSEFMVHILRKGNTGRLPRAMTDIIDMYTSVDNSNALVFDNTQKRTKSTQALHTTMLQRDIYNDFHKGFMRKQHVRQ